MGMLLVGTRMGTRTGKRMSLLDMLASRSCWAGGEKRGAAELGAALLLCPNPLVLGFQAMALASCHPVSMAMPPHMSQEAPVAPACHHMVFCHRH